MITNSVLLVIIADDSIDIFVVITITINIAIIKVTIILNTKSCLINRGLTSHHEKIRDVLTFFHCITWPIHAIQNIQKMADEWL